MSQGGATPNVDLPMKYAVNLSSAIAAMREPDLAEQIAKLPLNRFRLFIHFLAGLVVEKGLHFAHCPHRLATSRAGNYGVVGGTLIWREIVSAALVAAKGDCDFDLIVH